MHFQCPKCEKEMTMTETTHRCDDCELESTLVEAAELFDDGQLVGIVDEDEAKQIAEDEAKQVIVTDLSEDIAALVEGEDLSEAFVEKAKTIFESAVASRVKAEVVSLEEAQAEALDEAKEELIEKVDNYLDHVVSEWMEDNQLAVESGIKVDMNESFAEGIADLLKEHFIQAPEDRWDIVEGLADKVESLEEKLDEAMEKNLASDKTILEAEKALAFVELVDGLADTQIEKLKDLAESVEAESVEEFVSKVVTLKESYFKTKSTDKSDPTDTIDESEETNEDDASSLKEAIRMLNRKL